MFVGIFSRFGSKGNFHIRRSLMNCHYVTGSMKSFFNNEKAEWIDLSFGNIRYLLTMDGSIAIQNNKIMPNV